MEELLKQQNIRITNITNPFDPLHNREFKEVPRGLSLKQCIDLVRDPLSGCYYVAAVNGQLVPEDADYSLIYPSGSVTLCASPQGGGGGKNVLRTILQVIVLIVSVTLTVAAPFGAPAWWTGAAGAMGISTATATTAFSVALGAMVAIAGNILISALLPYDMSTDINGAGEQSSPTYSWSPGENANREGVVWPVLYGTARIVPPIIGKYIEVIGDKQYLNILYAIADHPITSIDETSIRLNDNAVTKGVDGITWDYRLGALNQSVIQYFNDARTLKVSGAKLSTSWTTIDADGTETEGLGVAVGFPKGLFNADDNGSLTPWSVNLDIEYKESASVAWTRLKQYNTTPIYREVTRWSAGYYSVDYDSLSGGYCNQQWIEVEAGSTILNDHYEGAPYSSASWINNEQFRHQYQWRWITTQETAYAVGEYAYDYITVTGSQSSALRRVFYADRIPAGTYQVRVKLHAAPNGSTRISEDAYLEYVESIIYDDFTYPGSSVFALRALATDKLSGGLPALSLVATRATVPVWTGAAYEDLPADNPAWASYDVLHNAQYGGGVPAAKIRYSDFLVWANNCDTHYISAGVASPTSFKCNYYIDASTSLRKILNDIGSLGRGNTVQMGSEFTCFVDKLETIPAQSFIFNVGNITSKSLSLEYLDMSSRANAVDVTYWDKDNLYKQKTLEIHANDFDATTSEVKKTQLTLKGCTSRAEALAHGYFALNNNRLLTCTATFSSDIDAIGCMPWDVIEVQHDVTLWGDGGRVLTATSNTIKLDKTLTLDPATTYTLRIQSSTDDTIAEYTLASVQKEAISDTVVIISTFDPLPVKYDKWIITSTGCATKYFRMLTTTRQDDLTRKLVCLEYNADIYDDSGTLEAPETPALPIYETNLKAEEIPLWDGSPETVVNLSWMGFAPVWHVFYKRTNSATINDPYAYSGNTATPHFRFDKLDYSVESYTFCVSHTRNPEDGISVDLTLAGSGAIVAPPATPLNFTAAINGQVIVLQWDKPTDIGVRGHTVYLNNVVIAENIAGNIFIYSGTLTAGTYNFTLAAVNRGGESTLTDAASITISVPTTPSPSAVVVGEQAVVTWADCKTTLPIDYYLINAGVQGKSPRYIDRINWVGGKDYHIIAVDIAGNQSAEGTTTLMVNALSTPTGITATGYTYAIRLDFAYETFTEFNALEIWASSTNNRDDAEKVGETAAKSWTHSGLPLIETLYYWIRTNNIYGQTGDWYPASRTAGVACATSSDPDDYLAILTGEISESELATSLLQRINLIDTSAFVVDDDVVVDNILLGIDGIYSGLSDIQVIHAAGIEAATSAAAAAQNTANTAVTNASTAAQAAAAAQITASLKINTFFAASAPTALQTGDLWFDTDAGNAPYRASAPGNNNWISIKDADIVTALANAAAAQTTANGKNVTFYAASAPTAHAAGDLWFDADDGNKVYRSTAAGSGSWVAVRDAAISDTVATLQALSAEVAGLTTSEWSATGDYILGKYVVYDGEVYRCLIAYTYDIDGTKTPGTDTDYWEAADSLATLVNQIETKVDTLTGEVATKVSNATYDLLEGRVDLAETAITQNAGAITLKADQSSLDDVDGRLLLAEASIVTHGDEIALKVSQEDFDVLGGKVATAESTLITHANEIEARVTTATFGELETRVSTAESTITQHSEDITLKVSKTDFDTFANLLIPDFDSDNEYDIGEYVKYSNVLYICIKTIDFSPAPTPTVISGWDTYWEVANFTEGFVNAVNQVAINQENISITSNAIIGYVALVPDIVVPGTVVETIGDVEDVDIRLTQAGIDINGVEASILLHAEAIDLLTNKMSQAEIDIDAAEANILLMASQSSLDDTNRRLTIAEADIDGAEGSIDLHATKIATLEGTTGTHTTQISQAQADIDAAEAAILLRASKTEIDGVMAAEYSATTVYNTGDLVRCYLDGEWSTYQCKTNSLVGTAPSDTTHWSKLDTVLSRLSTAEIDIDAVEAAITLRVTKADYDGDQKVDGVLRITSAESRLTAIDDPEDGTIAALTSRVTAVDEADTGRLAVAESTLSAAVDDVDGVKAQYTVKLNANNRVAGFGLMLSEDAPSEFTIVAEKFKVIDNADALDPKQVFTVGTINGVSGVGISGDLIVDGSILARNIGANEIIANTANIKDAVITDAKISALDAGKITTGYLSADRIEAKTIAASKLNFTNLAGLNATEGAKLSGIATGADVTLSQINGGLSVTGGGITLSGGGSIKGGQTDYNTGTGFFLGYSSSKYKLSIGKSNGNYLTWDGSELGLNGKLSGSFTNSLFRVGWLQDRAVIPGVGIWTIPGYYERKIADFFIADSSYVITEIAYQFWSNAGGYVTSMAFELLNGGAVIFTADGTGNGFGWTGAQPWVNATLATPLVGSQGAKTGTWNTGADTALTQRLYGSGQSGGNQKCGIRFRIIAYRIATNPFPDGGWGEDLWEG